MTEHISSFIDNIKQKSTNPFFGTLILVYIIRNWELIYSLFVFDDECTHANKIHYIYNYLHVNSDKVNILYNVLIAILAYVIGLIVIIGTRFTVDFKDNTIIPWLYNKSISDKVVNKDDYIEMTKQRDTFLDDLIKERERFSSVELDNKNLRKTITDNSKTYNDLNSNYQDLLTQQANSRKIIDNLNLKNRELSKEVENKENSINEKNKTITILDNTIQTKKIQIQKLLESNINIDDDRILFVEHHFDTDSIDEYILFVEKCLNTELSGSDMNIDFLEKYRTLGLIGVNNNSIINLINEGDYTTNNIYITNFGLTFYNKCKKEK